MHAVPGPAHDIVGVAPRFSSLIGEPRMIGRALGAVFLLGSVIGGVAIATAVATEDGLHVDVALTVAIVAVSAGIGLSLLAGAFDRRPARFLNVAIAAGTVLVTVGGHVADPDASTFRHFYLWLVPVLFTHLPVRDIVLQVALMGAGSWLVPTLAEPDGTAPLGAWIGSTATIVLVGAATRALLASLRSLEGRVGRAFSQSPIGMALVDIDGRFLDANDALCRMLRMRRSQVVGLNIADTTHPDHLEHLLHAVGHAYSDPGSVSEIEKRCATGDGSLLWTRLTITRLGDNIFAQARDVTAQWLLSDGPLHDEVTGLPSRGLAIDRLGKLLEEHDAGGSVAVIVTGIDGFAAVNDSFGPHVGDEVLRAVARRFLGAQPTPHTVARIGGDEFAVLVPGIVFPAAAVAAAEGVLASLSEPLELTGPTPSVKARASAGVTMSSAGDDPSESLRDALTAMHRAKASNATPRPVIMFDRAMREAAASRIRMEHELRFAVENGELTIEYQPIVDVDSGEIVSAEALVRWDHPIEGRRRPDEFIPLAEDTGLIAPMGAWVLRNAAATAHRWLEQRLVPPGFRVSVNVSARQADDPNELIDVIRRSLTSVAGAQNLLTIELTETTVADIAHMPYLLQQCRSLGVHVHLDDFGTGYSSFGSLQAHPADALKIDRSFIDLLAESERDRALVRALVDMARALGLDVIAEGVETPEQLAVLRELGCRYVQGYLLHRPMAPGEFTQLLRTRAATIG